MNKSLIIGTCIILIIISMVSAIDYYFNGTSGDDSYNCQSSTYACKTFVRLQVISNASVRNGFVYLLSTEEPHRGKWCPSIDNITLTSYPSGTKAKIYGSVNASAMGYWTDNTNNRWVSQKNFTVSPNQIFYDTNSVPKIGLRALNDSVLDTQWEWYFNTTNQTVVVYSVGNPAGIGNGIELPAYNCSSQPATIYVTADSGSKFLNLSLWYTGLNGLYTYSDDSVLIQNMDFYYGYWKGLFIDHGDDVLINNCSFYKMGIRGSDPPEGVSAQGENIFVSLATNVSVTNSVVERCGGVCINYYHTSGGIISGNNVFNAEQGMLSTAWTAGIYYDGCNDSTTSYNNVTDTFIGLQVGAEAVGITSNRINFTNNIVSNFNLSGILTDAADNDAIRNIIFTHNTVYKPVHFGGSGWGNQIRFEHYINITFIDNIVYNNYTNTTDGYLIYAANGTLGSGLISDYNLWNSTNRNNFLYQSTNNVGLAAWIIDSGGQDSNSLTGNPLFVSGTYQPGSISPACTMSSTGSYVGAVPCASSEVVSGNASLMVFRGSAVLRVLSGVLRFY
jgi:hypothetical protein